MLDVLKNTGLNARLTPEVYDLYAEEVNKREKEWKKSLEYLYSCHISFYDGIENNISEPICQYDCPNIIYDYRECRVVNNVVDVPEGYKTMATNGTVPCALTPIISQYRSLPEIGKVLVEYGYLTKDKGTLWIAMDKIPELVYGIQTEILSHFLELAKEVSEGHPVIVLVPAAWLHDLPSLSSNECVTVWRLKGKKVIVTTTSSHSVKELDLYDFLINVKRAWAFHRM